MLNVRFVVLVIYCVIISSCGNDMDELPINTNPFIIEQGSRPLVIAHRGGTYFYPENTMLAFKYSEQIGADVLELDLHITADDKIVVCHDNTIDRTSDQTGYISQLTYAELETINFGYNFKNADGEYPYRDSIVKIPLLEEVFQEFPNMHMIIENKAVNGQGRRVVDALLPLIDEYNMQDKVSVFSFDNAITNYYSSLNDIDTYTGGSANDILDFILKSSTGNSSQINVQYDMLVVPFEVADLPLNSDQPSIVNAANEKGVSLCYWTINEEADMRRLIENNVDGIITDRAEILMEVLDDMGY